MYHDALHDPKVQQLPLEQFKAWFNLLCMASANPERGHLPPVKDIAYTLRLSPAKASNLVEALITAELIDRDASGNLRPHNWDVRQFKADDVNARSRKLRGKTPDSCPEPPPKATLQATLQKEEMQRSSQQPRNVVGNGISSARADSDPDSNAEPEPRELTPNVVNSADVDDDDDDRPELDSSYLKAAERQGYQVISRGHRKTIEHTRNLFGDACAVAVGNNGMRIHQHLGGGWGYFRASAENLKRSGKSKNDFVTAVLVVAKDYRSTGMPSPPVPVSADPDAARPRVFSPSSPPPRQNAAQVNQQRMRNAFSKVDPKRLKDIS